VSITPSALLARIDGGAAPAILDVRSRWEFGRGHVPGAIHVPFWRIGARRAAVRAAADETVVVYCGHGPRAWIAAAALRRLGFRRVTLLASHWRGWRRARLRVATERRGNSI
jgi:rhodanese-related sulfurtransferase